MKLILAVIKPFRLDDVRDALAPLGLPGMTLGEVRGFGRRTGQTEIYRGAERQVHFQAKLKLELAVEDSLAEQVLEAVTSGARSGSVGDGKVFMLDIERMVRIRTGETDADAL